MENILEILYDQVNMTCPVKNLPSRTRPLPERRVSEANI